MSGSLYTYEQFINELYRYSVSKDAEVGKSRLLNVCAAKAGASLEERRSLSFFLNEGFTDEIFSLAFEVNEESYAEKFKAMATRAQDTLKTKGKEYADKIGQGAKTALKFGGKILAPLKAVIAKIGEFLKKAWDVIKSAVQNAVAKAQEKLQQKLEPFLKDSERKRSLIEELGNIKNVATASVKWATGGVLGSMQAAGVKAATTDESIDFTAALENAMYLAAADVIENEYTLDELNEELAIFENHGEAKGGIHIPFISSVMDKISKFPPFSILHGIEAKIEKTTEKGLNRFSALASKIANAPGPYEFPVLAGMVALVAGHLIDEHLDVGLEKIAELAEEMLGFVIPGFGIATRFMKYGGMALAVHGVIQHTVGGKEEKEEEEGEEEKKKEEE